MAGKWRESELGDVVRLQRGHDLPDKERKLGHVPIVGSFGVTGWHNDVRAKGPGVTIGRSGASIGVVSFVREDYWPLNTCLYVTDFQGSDPRFCYYWLSTLNLANYNSGSAQPSLNRNYIYGMPVRVPSPEEQRAIAHILGTLDDKIELNRQMNETLESMARALFKSWFVDFDPVHAKAEGRDPELPKHVATLFPRRLQASGFGQIPEGWCVYRWRELVTLEYGKSLSGYENDEGSYPVYGTNGRIGSHSEPLCTHAGIIIGRKGAYRGVHFCNSPFFVIDTAFYIEPKEPVDLRWAYYELLRQDINSMDSGSAIPSTSREDFYSLPVLAPPFDIQQCFVELLTPFWARQEQNEKESRTLAALRDALLPKLISGDLRIEDAERFLKERGL